MGPIAVPIDWLLGHIPIVRDINFGAEDIERKLGLLGEPMVIGGVLGTVIGALAGYELHAALSLGVRMAAVAALMPKVVKCIVKGLLPISEAAMARLQGDFYGEKFYVGLDPAILLGDSRVISIGLVFIPITIFIAMIIPGNEVLPLGDLATTSFFIAMAVGVHRGNLFRILISGSVIMAMTIWISNQTITLNTVLARSVCSPLIVDRMTRIASFDQGGSPVTYLLAESFHVTNMTGFVVVGSIYVICLLCTALMRLPRG
jgi:PTS system galactitol-specific IIC component